MSEVVLLRSNEAPLEERLATSCATPPAVHAGIVAQGTSTYCVVEVSNLPHLDVFQPSFEQRKDGFHD